MKEAGRGVARAALDGASRLEITDEALRELRSDGTADRVGIWLASEIESAYGTKATVETAMPNTEQGADENTRSTDRVWRGLVWDRESESMPQEWQQLSAEAPVPDEVVFGGRSVEQELGDGKQLMLISILMELQKVLWVPIAVHGRVQGVILCGARNAGVTLPVLQAQRVAAELTLHLLWARERAVARERHADMALTRWVHAEVESAMGAAQAGGSSKNAARKSAVSKA